jgi:hypothetical protein
VAGEVRLLLGADGVDAGVNSLAQAGVCADVGRGAAVQAGRWRAVLWRAALCLAVRARLVRIWAAQAVAFPWWRDALLRLLPVMVGWRFFLAG